MQVDAFYEGDAGEGAEETPCPYEEGVGLVFGGGGWAVA